MALGLTSRNLQVGAPQAGGRPGVVHHLGHLVGDGVAEVGPVGSQDVAFS
jgi:hypothetical protein